MAILWKKWIPGCSIQLSPYYRPYQWQLIACVAYGKDNLKPHTEEMYPPSILNWQLTLFDKTDQKEDFATDFWKGFDEIKFLYKNESCIKMKKNADCVKIDAINHQKK